jgi:aspartate/methionine/tyrosine aminotransferase
MTLFESLRREARLAPESGIVAVANHGRGKDGLIPLWAGESDLPTPDFISAPTIAALQAGETFYTWQRGIPELRQALADYHGRHFGGTFAPEEFIVTGSGMQAIQMALDAVAGHGDEVIHLSPAWPNFAAAVGISGATNVAVPLERSSQGGWWCDPAAVEKAVTRRTRALFVNTPANPSGWTADRETLSALLDIARRHGLWIIADEIYALFHYGEGRAPSFMDVAEKNDRILFVNSFSKNWAMTGWRMGWLKVDPSLQQVFENLVQYSTSGVPQFLQRGAVAALNEGDAFLAGQVAQARHCRDMLIDRLRATGRVKTAAPQGAFYLFFEIEGVSDTTAAALRIVDEARVGLAPGTAFGPGGEGFFRACYHRRPDHVEEAADRLARWIAAL